MLTARVMLSAIRRGRNSRYHRSALRPSRPAVEVLWVWVAAISMCSVGIPVASDASSLASSITSCQSMVLSQMTIAIRVEAVV